MLVIREVDSQKFMQITYQKNAFNREACQAALREMAKLLFEAALLEEEARREQESALKARAKLLAEEAVVEKKLRESRKKVAGLREVLQKTTKLRQEAGKMQNGTPLEQLQKVNIFLEAIKAEDKATKDLAEGLTKPIVSGKVDG